MALRLPELPEPGRRWTPARKEAVLLHVKATPAARAALLSRYEISNAELDEWERRRSRFGQAGLKTTKIQDVC